MRGVFLSLCPTSPLSRACRLTIVALLVAGTLAFATGKWLLRLELHPGEVYHIATTDTWWVTIDLGSLGKQTQENTRRVEMRHVVTARAPDGTSDTAATFVRVMDIITRGGATQRFDTAEPPGPEWLEGPSQRLLRGLIGKTLTLQRSPRGVVQGVSGMEALWMQLAHVLPDEPFARQVLQVMRHAFSDEVLRSTFELAAPVFPEAPVALGETWKRPLDVSNTVMGGLRGMDTYRVEGEEPRAYKGRFFEK